MIFCISALPITPSGLGVRENLFVLMLAVPGNCRPQNHRPLPLPARLRRQPFLEPGRRRRLPEPEEETTPRRSDPRRKRRGGRMKETRAATRLPGRIMGVRELAPALLCLDSKTGVDAITGKAERGQPQPRELIAGPVQALDEPAIERAGLAKCVVRGIVARKRHALPGGIADGDIEEISALAQRKGASIKELQAAFPAGAPIHAPRIENAVAQQVERGRGRNAVAHQQHPVANAAPLFDLRQDFRALAGRCNR